MRLAASLIAVTLALAACREPPVMEVAEAPAPAEELPPLNPPAPGEPGGLPDDRTPLASLSEGGGPIDPDSAQGAGQILQTYWALVEQGDYAQAYTLWSDDGAASGMDDGAFAASFAKYSEIHAMIGGPGEIEGAAGSLYVDYPVQVYGRMADDGAEFTMQGPMTLHRVNDVPGATAEQLEWRIAASDLDARP